MIEHRVDGQTKGNSLAGCTSHLPPVDTRLSRVGDGGGCGASGFGNSMLAISRCCDGQQSMRPDGFLPSPRASSHVSLFDARFGSQQMRGTSKLRDESRKSKTKLPFTDERVKR